ncbi:RecD-like DNA helicase YrrC [Bilophila wadsworthia]|uniref:SF1B family DNA helicase RecD2 n=1 Tax=Bilophila wadsworthia TaxID=35833 RepID=UPI003D6E9AC6
MTQLSLSSLDDTVELQGTLERVVFHNEENGYTVFRVRPEGKDEVDLVTVVGHMGSPQAGASLRIKGRWVNNARFGRQVQMDSFESLLPATAEGIKLYLASGLIKGIGKSIAARIVKAFGEDTLRIFDEEPQRLLEISGITQKKLVTIVECWTEHQGVRNLVQFLQPHDIGASFAVRIYKHYGPQALSIVQENPYRLAMDIRGIGFLTADALAAKLGFESEHPLRIQAGTLYTLMKQIDDGHVYYPRRALVEQTCSQLGIAEEFVEEAVDCLAREERVVLEELDDEIGVYLTRFYHYESKIAYYLRRILASPKSVRFPKADEVVEKVVSRLGITLAEEQLEAVRTSATSKVMVLTGGPGTGKTTILNAIIQVFAENKAKILLAAPTGRAAKRMSEAIGREARTIHRLLEYTPKDDGFARNEDNPLACGLLVVDEASMMDTMLAYHLLKAAPLGATIVFVGDVHQLPSVGPGNVLGDLIASGAMPVVELVEVFRQAAESEIVCNAHLINRGELPRLESSKDRLSDFYFMRQDDPDRAADIIVDLVKNHIPRRFQLDPFDEIQVLSPMHKGTVGAANLNLRLQQALNPEGEALQRGERFYRLGDKVMQIRNNYEKDVYNGDIGRVSSVDVQEKCLVVRYDDRYVGYDWEELDEIVAAYAISIHKSQGSEYPAVVIPLMTQHYMLLQRNLIYTGVTRGKRLVVLVGEPRALAMAVKNNRMQKRYTWLARRLGAAPEAAGPQTEGERT